MKLSQLENAFIIPDNCKKVMQQTAYNVSCAPEAPSRRVPLRRSFTLAFGLLLILASVAFAAVRFGILDYLIGKNEPTTELSAYAQPLYVHEEVDHVAITVTGAMYDGEKLALSYSVENLKPENLVSLHIESVTLGNKRADPVFVFPDRESWIPYAFGMQELSWSRNPVSGGMNCIVYSEPLRGQQEVIVHYSVHRPLHPLVVLDEGLIEPLDSIEDDEYRAEKQALIDAILSSGVKIADRQHQDAQWWNDKGYGVLDITGSFFWPEITFHEDMTEEEFYALLDTANEKWSYEAQTEQTGKGALRFIIDADRGLEHRNEYVFTDSAESQQEVSLMDCKVILERFTMTPLSTHMIFLMYPLENTYEAAEELRLQYRWLELRDENDDIIEFASMENECSDGLIRQNENDEWMVEWNWSLAGAITVPTEVRVTAVAAIDEEQIATEEQVKAFGVFAEKMRLRMK